MTGSREISELTGKRHDNVLRDVEKMLAEVGEDLPKFGDIYLDAYGRPQKGLRLPKDLTLTLIAGYRADLRLKIIRRWMELEEVLPPEPASAPSVNALMIAGTDIRRDAEGRYCLNDCHKASCFGPSKRPGEWLRYDQAKDLIAEVTSAGIHAVPVSAINGGSAPGTYAVKELVYAYAMWISPSFHLKVIRAFDGLVTGRAVVAPVESVRDLLKAS